MAKRNLTNGTLFMALEVGATWPAHIRDVKKKEANFQAIVQDSGETAEHFAGRTLEKWHKLVDSSTPPFRFMLGTRPNPDEGAVAARERIARGVFECGGAQAGPSELILWSGATATSEEQTRLLSLVDSLFENSGGSERSVRVLFGDSRSLPFNRRARTRELRVQ